MTTVRSLDYDRAVRKEWQCRLIRRSGPSMLFVGVFDRDVSHPALGVIQRGTISYEYFWLDRQYNIFEFRFPNRSFRNYYCNVTMPPIYSCGLLEYVDLDFDLVYWPDGTFEVLDVEDFETNAARFAFDANVRRSALAALDVLIGFAKTRAFPKI